MKKVAIIVVDDSKVVIERLVPTLEELAGVEKVVVAYSFAEGLRLVQTQAFDVAIFDVNLPDQSGVELLRLVKAAKYPIGTTIVMTDAPSPETKAVCLALGANHFLNKFEDFEQIPKIIQQF